METNDWITAAVAVIAALCASGGFWTYLQKKGSTKSALEKLTIAMGQDRIVHLGMKYIERGWISKDEYDDYVKNLCEPYFEVGGNGLGEKVYNEVKLLKIYTRGKPITTEIQIVKQGEH